MRSIQVTIRVVIGNPNLQTKKVKKAEAEYFVDRLIGILTLPDVELGEPATQLLTMGGPVDCYDTAEAIRAKLEAACIEL